MNKYKIFALILISVMFLSGYVNRTPVTDHISAVLILDNSGSMQTNDPDGLRFSGARMFISLMDTGDSVGIITFSTASQPLTHGLITIGNQNQTSALEGLLSPIKPNGYTDVKAAFQDAANMLNGATSQLNKPVIVFLTDGQPEIPNPYPDYESETLNLAKSLNVPVLAIALTHSAQTPFLDRLAEISGGSVIAAKSASGLLDAYLEVFRRIKDRTILGNGQSTAPTTTSIFLDPALVPYVQKTSFVVGESGKLSAVLYAPDGTALNSNSPDVLSDTTDPAFTTITVNHPMGGNWAVHLDGSGKAVVRAILYSRLRVEIVSPGSAFESGKPLPIVVQLWEDVPDGEPIKIIGDANFSAVITRPDGSVESLDQFYDDGTHGDAKAGDGDYTRLYVNTDLPGQYTLLINGIKGIVPVTQTIHSEGIQFPALVVDQPLGAYEFRGQPLPLQVHLDGGQPSLLDQGNIVAHIFSPSGTDQPVLLQGNTGIYTGVFSPKEQGVYRVRFESDQAIYRGLPYTESVGTQTEVKIVRTLTVASSNTAMAECFARDVRLPIQLTLASLQAENVIVSLKNVSGLTAPSANLNLKPGQINMQYLLSPSQWLLMGGEYKGELTFASDPGLNVLPAQTISVDFFVPSPFTRCKSVIGWGGLVLVGALVLGITGTHQLHINSLPPLVTGTLRYWPGDGNTGQSREIDLTALKKPELHIGRAPDCDVSIPNETINVEHAVLHVEKTAEGNRIVLQPIGEVRKGYVQVRTNILLAHGTEFRMGDQEFQYLSDYGE